jgi:serine protease inhibitor
MKYLVAVATCLMLGGGAMPKADSSPGTSALARPYAQFGFDVLRQLASQRPDRNVFISPTSIAVALAMTSNGANGATQSAILRTLHADTQPADTQAMDTFNAANRELAEQLSKTTAVQLSIANALWVQQGLPVNPAFQQVLQTDYEAQAENLDFRNPASVETINAWVAKHTNDLIHHLVDHVDPLTVAMLTNAIAFKGKWTLQFDPKSTQPHEFRPANGAVLQVPPLQVQMMKNSAQYAYAGANGLEAIRLPYADGTFAMYVVLPQDSNGMQSFLRQLTPDTFTALVSSLHTQRGTIELPRFTITYDATLNATLTKLGMGIAFGNDANFEGIRKSPRMQISEVRHASFLKVDEEGTEAAAATSVGMRATVMRLEPQPFHMVVDHPFFVAIRDEGNGQLLFTGLIAKPEN